MNNSVNPKNAENKIAEFANSADSDEVAHNVVVVVVLLF